MGLLDKRKRSIAENAAEHMEPGEQVQAMVMTQTGESAAETGASGAGGGGAGTAAVVHALAATDRNVYAFVIPGLTSVAGAAIKVPLAEADISMDGKRKVVLNGTTFNVLFFAGKDAKALVEYVETAR
jgi:hypothetical protein